MGCAQSTQQGELGTVIKDGHAELLRQKLPGLDDAGLIKALHKAVKHFQPACVEVLLQSGANAAAKDQDGHNVFHILVMELGKHSQRVSDAVEVVNVLGKHLGNTGVRTLDVADKDGTPLLLALANKQEALARAFMAVGCSPTNATNSDKSNALHLAIMSGNPGLASDVMKAAEKQFVLQRIVNQPNMQGISPLHRTVAMKMGDTADELLALPSINVNAQDAQGNTPLHATYLAMLAVPNNPAMSSMARKFLSKGAAIDLPNRSGQTCFSLAVDLAAAALDPPAGVRREALLEPLAAMAEGQGKLALDTTGAVFNAQGMKGLSAVHVAALLGDVGMLSGLINRGADVDVHNLRGQPASMLAAQAGQKSLLVALFGPLGADPLCMDRQGTSPVAQLLMTSSARLPPEDLKEVLLAILESPNPNVSDIQRLSSQPATTAGTPTLPGPLPLLHLACALGRLEVVQQLVNDAHMPPDAPSSDRHMTPLAVTVAAYCASPKEGPKFLPIAEFLVKQGANPVARDQAGATPLGRALDEGHLDLAMALIRHARQHVDFQSPSGSTALYVAILQGARPAVEELVTQLGASVRPQPRFTPLHVAVGSQQPAVAQFLLTQPQVQESMNQPDCNKMTALGYLWTAWQPEALSKAHAARLPKRGSADLTATQVQLAQMLLAQPGCDPNAPDASGKRLLHLAVEQNRVALIKTLARTARGLDPNLPDSDGVTPLYRAVQKGDATLVEALTTSLPKLDVCAPSRVPGLEAGRTPLQAAVAAGNVALCALLVDQPSVRLDMPVFKLCMGLLDAKPQVCEAILGQLLHPSRAAKCSIDLSVAKACTFTAVIGSEKVELPPLHYVARLDKAKLVELLVKQGKANVNATDNRGLTALHHAVACKAITAANALVNAGADVSALGNAPTTPLIAAATSLDVALVALLLGSTKQYNVNATDGQGHTALSSVCQMLLEAPLERPSQSGTAAMQGAPSITSMASMKPSMTAKSEMMMASPHNVRVELAAYSVANPPLEAMSFASTSTESFASIPAGHRNPSSQASLTSLKDAEEIVKLLLRKGADPNHAIPPSALRDISRNLTSQITSLASSSALLSPTRRPLRSAPSAAWKSPGLSLSPAPSLAASSTSMDTLGLELFTPLLLAIQLRSQHVLDLLLCESPGETLDMNGAQGRSWPAVQVAIQVVQLLAEELAKLAQERPSKPAVRDSKSNFPSIFARFLKDPRSGATLGSHDEVMEAAVRILEKLLADPRVDLAAPGDGMLLQQVVEAGGPYTLRILRMLMAATGCKRADINAVNPTNGTTVLHTAAAKNEREVVELLAKAKGVNFNLLDKEGHTPLAAAVQAGARDAIATLLQHGLTNEYAAGPLDPLLCGDDPATSPMALAIAHPEHRVVHALVSGLAYANLSHNTSVVPHHNHKSSSDLKAAAKDALNNTNANGSAPAKYDIEAVLNNPIDKAGRAPVLVATKALKLDHAQVLVKTERQTWPGAALDVTEPEPLIRAGSTGASAANGQAPDAEQSQATPLHLVLEHIITLDAQAKSKTKGGEARQLLTRAAVLASDMASAPSMARAVGLADAVGFTPLHWAVMARLEDVVQILCPKARKLGSINAAADTEKGQGFTALHLAAKLNLVTCAHYLLLHAADASLTMRDGKTTALMVCASEEMRLLLLNPPAITVQVDTGNGAPVIKKRGTFASGYDNFTGQLAYTWNQVKGGGTNGFQKRSSTAKVDGNKVVIEDPEAAARARQASKSLYQSFRTALEVGKSAGQALGPLGAALVAVCSVADQLLEGVDKLVFSNMIVSHICGRIKRQVPTLQALRKALEQSKSEEAAQQLLPHVGNLGEVYIKIHRMVEEWSVQGKAALVARVFASQDFWEDLMEEERMLTGCMTDLGTAVNALNLMGMKVNMESVDPEQAKEEARAAIRQDMQMAMAHILEVEAMSSDVAAAHAAATKTFKQYGLDYNKLKRKERRRWRTDKLRDLIIPAAELQIVAKVGTGGSAQVFRAMYQGYPVAYKQFEALPNQGDLLREGVENEAYIMSMLRHPNVIQIFGMVADKDKNSYGLVVDYHAPGSLQNMIDSRMHAEPISIQERVALVLQIARGMAYLHGRSIEPIVHGDLKPSNVLISEDGRAVITDFGMSRVTSNTTTTTAAHQTSDTFTSNASAVYTAPEVVGLLLEGKKRPPSSDVFSFGVLCLELLTLQPCYTGFAANPGEYSCKVAAGQRPSIPTELPQVLRECIEACWDHEPAKRPAFDEVVEVLDYVYASVSGGAGPAA